MVLLDYLTLLLSIGAALVVISTVPYAYTAISYRQRDNGLAYLLLVLGVGMWNGLTISQLLASDPSTKLYFLSLSVLGAALAALGWFLFASTASRTADTLDRPDAYAAVATLAGVDVSLALTAPVHDLYWLAPADATPAAEFLAIVPQVGYWFHTVLLVGLFGAGTFLFAGAWRRDVSVPYNRAYAVGGTLTVLGLVLTMAVLLRHVPLASITAGILTTTGWIQARRGDVFRSVRRYVRSLRPSR